jgi:glutamine synthetase
MSDARPTTFAVTDGWGRLMGKRYRAAHIAGRAPAAAIPFSEAIFATDIRLFDIPGIFGDQAGTAYPDLEGRPCAQASWDAPWADERLVLCDLFRADGSPFALAPRKLLQDQIARAASAGFTFRFASEFEFYLLDGADNAPPSAASRARRASAGQRQDCDLVETERHVELIEHICSALERAGIGVEYWKGESGVDQYEIVLGHAETLAAADRATIFKHWVKRAARRRGITASFIAKLANHEDGSGGHVHCSIIAKPRATQLEAFAASLSSNAIHFVPLLAPLPNSYKRLLSGAFAPSDFSLRGDDRNAAVRILGDGASRRLEFRVPGADANQYLVYAAMIAAGLAGGNRSAVAAMPRDAREGLDTFAASTLARRAFGDEAVDYYTRLFSHEADVAAQSVTDWEIARYWRQA